MTPSDNSGSKAKPEYWKLDEQRNAVDYLERSVRHLMETEANPWAWKWVVIALHGAVYGFGVCAVRGTDYSRVSRKTRRGEDFLKTFDEIMEMCQQDTWMKQFGNSKILNLTPEQKRAIEFLKAEFRNKFEHFVPGLWWIETHGLPDMVAHCYDVIEFLALNSGNLMWKPYERNRIDALCKSGKGLARSLRLHWEISEENDSANDMDST